MHVGWGRGLEDMYKTVGAQVKYGQRMREEVVSTCGLFHLKEGKNSKRCFVSML